MPSSPRLRLCRIIRPSLVLSQSFTDRLWCGQSEKWWIMGRSRDQFGPEGPEVSTSAACRSPAARDQAKGRRVAGDRNLKLEAPRGTDSSQTPRWREMNSNFRFRDRQAKWRRMRYGFSCSTTERLLGLTLAGDDLSGLPKTFPATHHVDNGSDVRASPTGMPALYPRP